MSETRFPSTAASPAGSGPVVVGSRVRVQDAEGEHEHLIVARVTGATSLGCVSEVSPAGKALLGRRAGELVQAHTPDGVHLLTIVHVVADALSPRERGGTRGMSTRLLKVLAAERRRQR